MEDSPKIQASDIQNDNNWLKIDNLNNINLDNYLKADDNIDNNCNNNSYPETIIDNIKNVSTFNNLNIINNMNHMNNIYMDNMENMNKIDNMDNLKNINNMNEINDMNKIDNRNNFDNMNNMENIYNINNIYNMGNINNIYNNTNNNLNLDENNNNMGNMYNNNINSKDNIDNMNNINNMDNKNNNENIKNINPMNNLDKIFNLNPINPLLDNMNLDNINNLEKINFMDNMNINNINNLEKINIMDNMNNMDNTAHMPNFDNVFNLNPKNPLENNMNNLNNINNKNNGLFNNMFHFQKTNNNNNFDLFTQEEFTKIECQKIFGSKLNNNKYRYNDKENKFDLNIIYYDESLKSSPENNLNCSFLKMHTLGTFYGVHHFSLFRYICKRIINDNKRFILISSGSSAIKVFNCCAHYSQISKLYIYCFYISKYINLTKNYPKLKGVYNKFNELCSALSSNHEIINYQIKSSNLIYLSDYNRVYIKLHYEIIRKYSLYKILKSQDDNKKKFLEIINKKFPYYLDIAIQLIYHDENDMIDFFKKNTNEPEEILKKVFNNIHNVKNYISNYTVESFYYKYINKFLREGNFESFRILSNHISKFIYHLYEYKKNHFQNKESILFRNMFITNEDFNTYLASIGKIICYPAFTSTSLNENGYFPNSIPNTIMVRLIIKQNHSKSVVCISDISQYQNEKEYLFMPFSFFKITNIIKGLGTPINPHLIFLTALRSEKSIEDMLLDFMQNETDNLDPEGLKMIKINDVDDTYMSLNPNLLQEIYKKM